MGKRFVIVSVIVIVIETETETETEIEDLVINIIDRVKTIAIESEIVPAIEKAIGTEMDPVTIKITIIDPQHSAVAEETIKRDFVKTKYRAMEADAIRFKRVVVVNAAVGITITIVMIGLFNPRVAVYAEAVAVHSISDIVPPNLRSVRSASVDAIMVEFAKKKHKMKEVDVQNFKRVVPIVVRAVVTNLHATKKETN